MDDGPKYTPPGVDPSFGPTPRLGPSLNDLRRLAQREKSLDKEFTYYPIKWLLETTDEFIDSLPGKTPGRDKDLDFLGSLPARVRESFQQLRGSVIQAICFNENKTPSSDVESTLTAGLDNILKRFSQSERLSLAQEYLVLHTFDPQLSERLKQALFSNNEQELIDTLKQVSLLGLHGEQDVLLAFARSLTKSSSALSNAPEALKEQLAQHLKATEILIELLQKFLAEEIPLQAFGGRNRLLYHDPQQLAPDKDDSSTQSQLRDSHTTSDHSIIDAQEDEDRRARLKKQQEELDKALHAYGEAVREEHEAEEKEWEDKVDELREKQRIITETIEEASEIRDSALALSLMQEDYKNPPSDNTRRELIALAQKLRTKPIMPGNAQD